MKPTSLVLLLLLLGGSVCAYALSLPYYTDQAAANQLLANWGNVGKEGYYKEEVKLRTHKTQLLDAGSGLAVVAILLYIFLLVSHIQRFAQITELQTPSAPAIWLSFNLAWLLLLPGTWWYYSYRAARGDYPPFADSVGIPVSAQILFLLMSLLPLNVLVALLLLKTRLPTRLLLRPTRRTLPVALWELLFVALLLVTVLLLGAFIYDGDHVSIISFCLLTYLLLCLRAGHLPAA